MQKILITLLASAAVFFISSSSASAQSLSGQQNPVQYVISPEVPGPNQTVLIQVQGVGTFLGESTITWQVDGKTVASGVGIRSFSIKTGNLGSQTKVHLIINSAAQGTITKDFSFSPSLVNFIWEADTSVPPWYLGKALYSAGSKVKVVAFPQVYIGGRIVTTDSLSYQWSQGDIPLPEQSGRGRNSILITGSQLQSGEAVSVNVQAGGSTIAHGDITIPASNPKIVFYERDPLRGVLYDNALSNNVSLNGKEVTLYAQPFYFSNDSISGGSTVYSWSLNGKETTGPDTARGLLTLRQTGTGAGSAVLRVKLQNTDSSKFVQAANTALQIVFGAPASNSQTFFSL